MHNDRHCTWAHHQQYGLMIFWVNFLDFWCSKSLLSNMMHRVISCDLLLFLRCSHDSYTTAAASADDDQDRETGKVPSWYEEYWNTDPRDSDVYYDVSWAVDFSFFFFRFISFLLIQFFSYQLKQLTTTATERDTIGRHTKDAPSGTTMMRIG